MSPFFPGPQYPLALDRDVCDSAFPFTGDRYVPFWNSRRLGGERARRGTEGLSNRKLSIIFNTVKQTGALEFGSLSQQLYELLA